MQIKVDPAGFDRLADDLEHLVVADAGRDDGLDDLLRDGRVLPKREDLLLFDDEDRSPPPRRQASAAPPPSWSSASSNSSSISSSNSIFCTTGSGARLTTGAGRGAWRAPCRRGRRLGRGGDQFARQLLDQAFQHPEIAGDLLALVLRLAFEIGAHVVDLGVHLVEFLGELIGPAEAADRRGRGIFAQRLIETLDAVGKQIEPGDVVLDPIDTLQVLVDDFERRLDLVQPVGGPVGRAPRASIR